LDELVQGVAEVLRVLKPSYRREVVDSSREMLKHGCYYIHLRETNSQSLEETEHGLKQSLLKVLNCLKSAAKEAESEQNPESEGKQLDIVSQMLLDTQQQHQHRLSRHISGSRGEFDVDLIF